MIKEATGSRVAGACRIKSHPFGTGSANTRCSTLVEVIDSVYGCDHLDAAELACSSRMLRSKPPRELEARGITLVDLVKNAHVCAGPYILGESAAASASTCRRMNPSQARCHASPNSPRECLFRMKT